MTKYRCKHAVEAMRWDGTSRELLTAWHEQKTLASEPPYFFEGVRSGAVHVRSGFAWKMLPVGCWLIWQDGRFLVMDDEQFRETYEEVI